MRATIIIVIVLIFALLGFFYAPETTLEFVSISVTEVDNGIRVENASNVACLIFINSPEGEQQFELAAGKSIMVVDITKPIVVSTVSK